MLPFDQWEQLDLPEVVCIPVFDEASWYMNVIITQFGEDGQVTDNTIIVFDSIECSKRVLPAEFLAFMETNEPTTMENAQVRKMQTPLTSGIHKLCHLESLVFILSKMESVEAIQAIRFHKGLE